MERGARLSIKINYIHNEYLRVKQQLKILEGRTIFTPQPIQNVEEIVIEPDVINDVIPEITSVVARTNTAATSTSAAETATRNCSLPATNSNAVNCATDARSNIVSAVPSVMITEADMTNISMQVNKGQPTHKCAKCSTVVTNDYTGHKEHVIKRHLNDYKEGDRAAYISKFIQVCFPGAIALNDLQCCICGLEMQSISGRRVHVGRQHAYCFVNCPQSSCGSVFPTIDSVTQHLRAVHRLSFTNLSVAERQEFEKQRATYNHKVRLLVIRCFPYPIPSGKSVDADAILDENLCTPNAETMFNVSNQRSETTLFHEISISDDDEPQERDLIEASYQDPSQQQSFSYMEDRQCDNNHVANSVPEPRAIENKDSSDDEDNELRRRKRISDLVMQIDMENKRRRSSGSFSLSNTRPYWEKQGGAPSRNRSGAPHRVEKSSHKANHIRFDNQTDESDGDETICGKEIDVLEVLDRSNHSTVPDMGVNRANNIPSSMHDYPMNPAKPISLAKIKFESSHNTRSRANEKSPKRMTPVKSKNVPTQLSKNQRRKQNKEQRDLKMQQQQQRRQQKQEKLQRQQEKRHRQQEKKQQQKANKQKVVDSPRAERSRNRQNSLDSRGSRGSSSRAPHEATLPAAPWPPNYGSPANNGGRPTMAIDARGYQQPTVRSPYNTKFYEIEKKVKREFP